MEKYIEITIATGFDVDSQTEQFETVELSEHLLIEYLTDFLRALNYKEAKAWVKAVKERTTLE